MTLTLRDPRQEIHLLTGPSRAGKTTVCRAVLQDARTRGLIAAGVLTDDAAAADGSRLQYTLDLTSGERRLLAAARGAATAIALGQDAGPRPATGDDGRRPASDRPGKDRPTALSSVPADGWTFDESGVAFGRAVLEACVHAPCDLLVIDQLGPLELVEGRGWNVAFDLLARGRYAVALVVVNPRVLERAVRMIGDCEVHVVDAAGRDALPAALSARLAPRS
jgi:nucleoside-triphosphatase THEP1